MLFKTSKRRCPDLPSMLPAETLAEVTAFLKFFELDALLLTDSFCSDIAQKSAADFRFEDFSEYDFDVFRNSIGITRLRGTGGGNYTYLTVPDYLCFICVAFRNCIFGCLTMHCDDVMRSAIENVSGTVACDTLRLRTRTSAGAREIVDLAHHFHKIKVCLKAEMRAFWTGTNALACTSFGSEIFLEKTWWDQCRQATTKPHLIPKKPQSKILL